MKCVHFLAGMGIRSGLRAFLIFKHSENLWKVRPAALRCSSHYSGGRGCHCGGFYQIDGGQIDAKQTKELFYAVQAMH